jgi:RNA polymerase sigma-70 factor (ECF subfamily)
LKSEDRTKEKAVHALPRIEPRTVPKTDATVQDLFELHHDRIYRVARRITGRAEDAEDVLQNVFLRLVRREEPVPPPEEAASYLHRAAANAAVDLLRRRKAQRSEPIGDDERFRDAAPGPELDRRSEEIGAKVREALAGLTPRAAEMFVLRYFEGYGNREIATMLNTSWSTVAVTLHRTRARLQKDLKGDLR